MQVYAIKNTQLSNNVCITNDGASNIQNKAFA